MIENCNLILKQKIECLIFQYVNPAFERLTGFRKSEILGSPTDNLLNEDKTATVSLSAFSLLCKKVYYLFCLVIGSTGLVMRTGIIC